LPDELAVMNHKLNIEALHSAAGLALARAGLLDAAEPLAERKIGLFDRILQKRPIDLVGKRVDEGRVAFELGETKGRTQRPDQRVHDVGDDVLGMIEFDAGHEVRVAGYVGDRETGLLRFRKHCGTLPFAPRQRVMAPALNASNYHSTNESANDRRSYPVRQFGREHPRERQALPH
jgi:hypothetical protein